MFDDKILKHYLVMSDAERVKEIRNAIHMDMPPLNLLFAVMFIVEPERVRQIVENLKK